MLTAQIVWVGEIIFSEYMNMKDGCQLGGGSHINCRGIHSRRGESARVVGIKGYGRRQDLK